MWTSTQFGQPTSAGGMRSLQTHVAFEVCNDARDLASADSSWTICLAAAPQARGPQQVGENKNPGEPQSFTLKVQSNLVVEAVEVKDKQGNFIHGLTAKDFVLTEDGAPQTIRYCEHQNLSETAKPLPPKTPATERRYDLQPAGARRRSRRKRWTTSATRISGCWPCTST